MKLLSIIALLLVLSLFYISNGNASDDKISIIPSASDADESQDVFLFLTSLQKLPKPSYRKPLARITIITYYQVREKKTQDEIASLLLAEIKRREWKPVELRFMEQEILVKSGDVTRRGKEVELRRITVN